MNRFYVIGRCMLLTDWFPFDWSACDWLPCLNRWHAIGTMCMELAYMSPHSVSHLSFVWCGCYGNNNGPHDFSGFLFEVLMWTACCSGGSVLGFFPATNTCNGELYVRKGNIPVELNSLPCYGFHTPRYMHPKQWTVTPYQAQANKNYNQRQFLVHCL